MTSKQYNCPVCDSPLTVNTSPGMTQLYCASGPCPSHASNWGGHGATEQEAYDALVKRVDADQQEKDSHDLH